MFAIPSNAYSRVKHVAKKKDRIHDFIFNRI
jgi:hypothetical protein